MRPLTLLLISGLLVLPSASPLLAQDGWNGARVLEMVDRARAERSRVIADDSLQNYAADARGYVYFYVDGIDGDETALVKTDQVALEVYWKAPDSTKQRIVGLRDEESLPTNIQYHLDHLTVVQDDYGDVIRLGDGDEVSAVAHPTAPNSQLLYDFRLADSITINLGGATEPVRVYEVDVRPKDFSRPGFVGSIFLDRATGAIVRMNFTFTAASYVDDYLDYIRISLDNSLWDGRYWLPYQQQVELRRELPYFDFPAGSVIRGRYEIRNYRFNEELSPFLFLGGRVSSVPREQRENYAFRDGLHAQIDQEGLGPLPELTDIRTEAARLAGKQALSGLGRFRPWVPSASWASRGNRVEGSAVGIGAAYRVRDNLRLASGLGYTFGRDRPFGTVRLEHTGPISYSLHLDWNSLEEVGGRQTASTALNTFAKIIDRDYLDPYFSTRARFRARTVRSRLLWTGSVEVREDRSATLVDLERPVRPIDDGTVTEVAVGASTTTLQGFGGSATLKSGRADGKGYATTEVEGHWLLDSMEQGLTLGASLSGGWSSTDAPLQTRALFGGRGTLLGYPYRGWAGDRWTYFNVEVSRAVLEPWVRLGVFGAVGSTWLRPSSVPETWAVTDTGLSRYSAGFTVQGFWDILRLDVGRGLNGGKWEAQLSLTRRFWHLL